MDKKSALYIIRNLYNKCGFSEQTALETFIPQLCEDEKIKEQLVEYIKERIKNESDETLVNTYESWIDWIGNHNCEAPFYIDDTFNKPKHDSNTKINTGHDYYDELLSNYKCDNIDDYARQCAYCLSHDWARENPTWEDVELACKLGAQFESNNNISFGELKILEQSIEKNKIVDSIMLKRLLEKLKNIC